MTILLSQKPAMQHSPPSLPQWTVLQPSKSTYSGVIHVDSSKPSLISDDEVEIDELANDEELLPSNITKLAKGRLIKLKQPYTSSQRKHVRFKSPTVRTFCHYQPTAADYYNFSSSSVQKHRHPTSSSFSYKQPTKSPLQSILLPHAVDLVKTKQPPHSITPSNASKLKLKRQIISNFLQQRAEYSDLRGITSRTNAVSSQTVEIQRPEVVTSAPLPASFSALQSEVDVSDDHQRVVEEAGKAQRKEERRNDASDAMEVDVLPPNSDISTFYDVPKHEESPITPSPKALPQPQPLIPRVSPPLTPVISTAPITPTTPPSGSSNGITSTTGTVTGPAAQPGLTPPPISNLPPSRPFSVLQNLNRVPARLQESQPPPQKPWTPTTSAQTQIQSALKKRAVGSLTDDRHEHEYDWHLHDRAPRIRRLEYGQHTGDRDYHHHYDPRAPSLAQAPVHGEPTGHSGTGTGTAAGAETGTGPSHIPSWGINEKICSDWINAIVGFEGALAKAKAAPEGSPTRIQANRECKLALKEAREAIELMDHGKNLLSLWIIKTTGILDTMRRFALGDGRVMTPVRELRIKAREVVTVWEERIRSGKS